MGSGSRQRRCSGLARLPADQASGGRHQCDRRGSRCLEGAGRWSTAATLLRADVSSDRGGKRVLLGCCGGSEGGCGDETVAMAMASLLRRDWREGSAKCGFAANDCVVAVSALSRTPVTKGKRKHNENKRREGVRSERLGLESTVCRLLMARARVLHCICIWR